MTLLSATMPNARRFLHDIKESTKCLSELVENEICYEM
jgi:hypothetical protein